ncbi:hypothetical protein C8J56DRAFT_150380 [Mycena floridula]|nr:hypothetical protein C8J56DRAFT_150380 [Mycena floridula]
MAIGTRRLWCLITGESSLFRVDVPVDEDVYAIQQLVVKETPPHVSASELVIWKLVQSLSTKPSNTLAARVSAQGSLSNFCVQLGPTDLVTSLFADVKNSDLHILVSFTDRPIGGVANDPISDLRRLRVKYNQDNPPAAPSSQGKTEPFFRRQEKSEQQIHFGRPAYDPDAIPATLLHPIFGEFLDDSSKCQPTRDDYALTRNLCSRMNQKFKTELLRASALRELLSDHGIKLTPTQIEGTEYETDGDMQHPDLFNLRFSILGVKNEIGHLNAEPFAQAILYYFESMRQWVERHPDCRFPCLLIILFGAHIAFAGAVYTDRPNFQILSPSLPLFFHSSHVEICEQITRYLGAFRKSVVSLKRHYDYDAFHPPHPLSNFPFMNRFRPSNGGDETSFQYVSKVHDKLLFFGLLGEEQICVKFTRKYSVDAHQMAATLGYAPTLRGLERLSGGWLMVIMDDARQHYQPLHLLSPLDRANVVPRIRTAIGALHQHGYVHGDFRAANILVKNADSFLFVDFDWAGKVGEARYPPNVNRDSIRRPDGAYDGQLITAQHDNDMAAYLW